MIIGTEKENATIAVEPNINRPKNLDVEQETKLELEINSTIFICFRISMFSDSCSPAVFAGKRNVHAAASRAKSLIKTNLPVKQIKSR